MMIKRPLGIDPGGHNFVFLNTSINNKPVFFSEVVTFKKNHPTIKRDGHISPQTIFSVTAVSRFITFGHPSRLAVPGKPATDPTITGSVARRHRHSDTPTQLKDLGQKLHRDLSGLSQAARRIELRAIEDADLSTTLEQLKLKAINSVCQACPLCKMKSCF
jgi:hypothetical protein